jgi:hypothetical protein
MKKIVFTGVDADVTEEKVREALASVGPISNVSIVRDGDPNQPVVIVEMQISDDAAYKLTTRVTDYWLNGHRINARLLLH